MLVGAEGEMIQYIVLKENGEFFRIIEGPKFTSEYHMYEWIEKESEKVEHGLRIVQKEYSFAGGRIDLLGVSLPELYLVAIECKNKSSPSVIREALDEIRWYTYIWRASRKQDIRGYVIYPIPEKFKETPYEYALLSMVFQKLEPKLDIELFSKKINEDITRVCTGFGYYPGALNYLLQNYELLNLEVLTDKKIGLSYLNAYPLYSKLFKYLMKQGLSGVNYFSQMFENGLPDKEVNVDQALKIIESKGPWAPIAIRLASFRLDSEENLENAINKSVSEILTFVNFVRRTRSEIILEKLLG